jgi:hypothetical protein
MRINRSQARRGTPPVRASKRENKIKIYEINFYFIFNLGLAGAPGHYRADILFLKLMRMRTLRARPVVHSDLARAMHPLIEGFQ